MSRVYLRNAIQFFQGGKIVKISLSHYEKKMAFLFA